MADHAITSVVYESSSPGKVILGIYNTNYKLYLDTEDTIDAHHHTRIKGIIRASVWKVDFVSKGGAYIEPVAGKPRRIQGKVEGHIEDENAILIELWNIVIVANLPERWTATEIPEGTKVAVDIQDIPTFELAPANASA